MEARTNTISKNFYDDEILFVYENGDIHLKEGVKRLGYATEKDTQSHERYINDDIIAKENFAKLLARVGIRQEEREEEV